jgi:hypothetical protein
MEVVKSLFSPFLNVKNGLLLVTYWCCPYISNLVLKTFVWQNMSIIVDQLKETPYIRKLREKHQYYYTCVSLISTAIIQYGCYHYYDILSSSLTYLNYFSLVRIGMTLLCDSYYILSKYNLMTFWLHVGLTAFYIRMKRRIEQRTNILSFMNNMYPEMTTFISDINNRYPDLRNKMETFIQHIVNEDLSFIIKYRDVEILALSKLPSKGFGDETTLEKECPLRCKGLYNFEQPSHEYSKECSICNEEIKENQMYRELGCQHRFHPECVDNWLILRSKECPLCRVDKSGDVI